MPLYTHKKKKKWRNDLLDQQLVESQAIAAAGFSLFEVSLLQLLTEHVGKW